ncbi:thioredoxin domain-containing protein [Procambarus clarkii]|uniref:thioredoxin domain-containing protein n=1 Tax=Procambarus clarkii TaxID=6728 RepID=UPI001E67348F|nr:thioredoxin domain-containing protein-like [Procambarus clarkii]
MAVSAVTCVLLALLAWPPITASSSLEVLAEDELRQLAADEHYVVVLFGDSSECTGRCKELEGTLALIREDIVETFNAWVVRTHSPSLAEQYGLNNKKMGAGVVFIRNGIPLLYSGPADDDEFMLNYLIANPESTVHQLSDVNFEHLTQASTGATTGDWLVMFTRSDCTTCTQLRATIEAVGANLKNKKNVALINRDNDGGQTTRRFGVKSFPSFLLFRQGRVYRYNLPGVDVGSLAAFAQEGFRNARAEDIPHPKTPFDDYTEWCADWLRENPSAVYAIGIVFIVLILLVIVTSLRSSKASSKKESKKKK